MATFINRQKETTFLKDWLSKEPNSLLFVYGPKSSGKTTLINWLIEKQLDHRKYAINYLNLRGVLVYNFQTFLDAFFVKSTQDKVKDIVGGITLNIGFFNISMDDDALLKKNPFKLMEDQLTKAKKKGLQPVIILDEIQTLKNIYFNGERNLLDELFNLFVRLTKEIHVAHIILLTSDSYFIEDIYNHSKLMKTTELYHVGHLLEEDVREWLLKENLEESDIQYVWGKIGGSSWEITQIISKYQNGESIKSACDYFIEEGLGKLSDFCARTLTEAEEALAHSVHRDIAKNGFAQVASYDKDIYPLISKMVGHDFWFYRTDKQQITANSESIRWAMQKMVSNK